MVAGTYGPVGFLSSVHCSPLALLTAHHARSASADDTAQILPQPEAGPAPKPLAHPVAVRALLPLALTDLGEPYLLTAAGDVLRTFDVSEPDAPQLLSQIDAHWHDITAIRLWIRRTVGDDGKTRVAPWIVTTSLDRTIRKWRLTGWYFFFFLVGQALTGRR